MELLDPLLSIFLLFTLAIYSLPCGQPQNKPSEQFTFETMQAAHTASAKDFRKESTAARLLGSGMQLSPPLFVDLL